MELDTPLTDQPVMPSIHETAGAATTRTVERTDKQLSREALLLNIIDGLAELIEDMGGVVPIDLDSHRTDNRQPATVSRVAPWYRIARREHGPADTLRTSD